MERVLRILLLVSILGGGDAITKDEIITRRYGGSNKRPAQYSAPTYGNTYGGSTGYASTTYGSSTNYRPGPTYNTPSISYNRPFGYPEGQKFAYGGFTYKTPQVPPPLPPLKAAYKSKPYPDFVVRFKPPLYPAEVTTFNTQKPFSYGVSSSVPVYSPPAASYNPSPGPVPVYQAATPAKAPIPIYGGQHGNDKQVLSVIATSQDVNVGSSYQTGSNIKYDPFSPPVYGNYPISSQVKPGLMDVNSLFNQAPAVLPASGPHATAVYVIDTQKADKFKMTSLNGQTVKTSHQPLEVAGFNKDSVFGGNSEHAVIKPLTPDIVYTPNDPKNDQDFKPMYLFGPVYFPKNQKTLRDNAESGSSTSELKSAAPNECDKTVNPNCTTIPDIVTAKPETATQAASKPTADKSNNDKGDEDLEYVDEEEDPPSLLRDSGTRRGLIGVVKTIFGLDEKRRDDGLSRVDEETEETENVEEDKNKEETLGEEETSVTADTKVDDADTTDTKVTSNRDSTGKRKRPSRIRSKSRYSSRSKLRRGGNNRRKTSSQNVGHTETLRTAGHEEQNGHTFTRPETTSNEQQEDFQEQPEQDFNDHVQYQQPVIGPVHIGYIGRPPEGSDFDPRHPFFYPAGIPPHSVISSHHNTVDQETERGDLHETGETPGSTSSETVADQQPQQVPPANLAVPPAVELEHPQPISAPALSEPHHSDGPQDLHTRLENPNNSDNEISHHQPGVEINSDPASVPSQLSQHSNHYHFEAGVSNQQQDVPQGYHSGNEFHQSNIQGQGLGSAIEKYDDATPRLDVAHSTEYQPHQFTTENPYPTYPQTNSYPGQIDSTSSSYKDNTFSSNLDYGQVGRYDYDGYVNPTGLQGSSGVIDQQVGESATVDTGNSANSDSNGNYNYETSADVNVISSTGYGTNSDSKSDIAVENPPTSYDYTSSNPTLDSASTSKSYVDAEEGIVISSTQDPISYTAGTRRISSNYRHRFRHGYQRTNANYVEPTTYRPVYFTRDNNAPESTEDAHLKDETGDSSATIYNSLNYDISSFTTPSPSNVEEAQSAPSTHIDTFEQFRPVITDLRYGERIPSKQTVKK